MAFERGLDVYLRALFYFLTGRWEEYESLDSDHATLRAAYEAGDERLRGRIAERARRGGRIEWIELATGRQRKNRLGEMSGKEWEATLALLFAGGRWEELWRLAQETPPRWSARILQRMNGNGWSLSREDEQRECEALIVPAAEWREPGLSSSIYCRATLKTRGEVSCLALRPDLRALTIEGWESINTVRWKSLSEGALTKTFKWKQDNVSSVAISPDGWLLAGGLRTGDVRLWSLPDDRLIKELKGHRHIVTSVAISPDGRLLVSGSEDGTVRLWSLPDVRFIDKLEVHGGGVKCLAISPDGLLLAVGSKDGTVRLWTSKLSELSKLPMDDVRWSDFDWVQATLRNGKTNDSERRSLEFMDVLMRRRRQFDIVVEESQPRIEIGKSDIEIGR